MRNLDLKTLGVSQDEVKAALVRERRPAVCRRLLAISKILAGNSIRQAARGAKAAQRSVERWLEQLRRRGFLSLLVDGRHGHAKRRMKPSEVAQTRGQVAAALAGPLQPQVRARLLAIDAVLSGQPIGDVAAAARVLPNAVRKWLRVVSRDGIDATVGGWQIDRRLRPGRLDVDPATLHELAAREKNPRVRKRMLALACVAEGMSTYDAEAKAGLNHWAITKRVKRFRKEGVEAFQDRKIAGRPRKSSVERRSKPAPCKRKRNVKEPPPPAQGASNTVETAPDVCFTTATRAAKKQCAEPRGTKRQHRRTCKTFGGTCKTKVDTH